MFLQQGPPKEVLSEIQGVLMPREDFQRFYGTEWLSDEVNLCSLSSSHYPNFPVCELLHEIN